MAIRNTGKIHNFRRKRKIWRDQFFWSVIQNSRKARYNIHDAEKFIVNSKLASITGYTWWKVFIARYLDVLRKSKWNRYLRNGFNCSCSSAAHSGGTNEHASRIDRSTKKYVFIFTEQISKLRGISKVKAHTLSATLRNKENITTYEDPEDTPLLLPSLHNPPERYAGTKQVQELPCKVLWQKVPKMAPGCGLRQHGEEGRRVGKRDCITKRRSPRITISFQKKSSSPQYSSLKFLQ